MCLAVCTYSVLPTNPKKEACCSHFTEKHSERSGDVIRITGLMELGFDSRSS